jgi:hypothetical protein
LFGKVNTSRRNIIPEVFTYSIPAEITSGSSKFKCREAAVIGRVMAIVNKMIDP